MSCPWGRFPRATLDTCEPDVYGAIVHPAETASALAYVIVALIVWRRYREADYRIPARHLPGIVAIIGLASGLFHASFTALFHALDLGVIFLLIGYLLTAQLVHRGQVAESNFPTVFVLFSIGGGLLPFLHLWLGFVGLVLGGVNRTGFLGDLIAWEDGGYGTSQSVFSGSARTCRPDGRGVPGGPRLRVGGAAVGGAEARLHGGDAAEVGAAGAA